MKTREELIAFCRTFPEAAADAPFHVLFAEQQYSTELADAIARETSAKVYLLDTGVSGEASVDAYLNAMRKNMETVEQAMKDLAAEKG